MHGMHCVCVQSTPDVACARTCAQRINTRAWCLLHACARSYVGQTYVREPCLTRVHGVCVCTCGACVACAWRAWTSTARMPCALVILVLDARTHQARFYACVVHVIIVVCVLCMHATYDVTRARVICVFCVCVRVAYSSCLCICASRLKASARTWSAMPVVTAWDAPDVCLARQVCVWGCACGVEHACMCLILCACLRVTAHVV